MHRMKMIGAVVTRRAAPVAGSQKGRLWRIAYQGDSTRATGAQQGVTLEVL
jgi:hypothetical protein